MVSAKGLVIGDYVMRRQARVTNVSLMPDIGSVEVTYDDDTVVRYRAGETLVIDDGIDRTSPGRMAPT